MTKDEIEKKAKKLLKKLYAKSKKVFKPVPLFESHSESSMTKNLADPDAMNKALKSMSPANTESSIMTTDQVRREMCKLAGQEEWYAEAINSSKCGIGLEILIKALWSINKKYRETCDGYYIEIRFNSIYVNLRADSFMYFKDYDTEQDALYASISYVIKEGM